MVVIEEVQEDFDEPLIEKPSSVFNGVTGLKYYERHYGSSDLRKETIPSGPYRSPFVKWAQDGDFIFLKIDVQDAVSPAVTIEKKRLELITEAKGASGVNVYKTELRLLNDVDEKESSFVTLPNQIDLKLQKTKRPSWWPRVQAEEKKMPWLSIDFNRWKNEDDDDDDEEDDEMAAFKRKGAQELASDMQERSRLQKELEELERKSAIPRKNLYLFFYNLVMCIGFSFVFWNLAYRLFRYGPDAYAGSASGIGKYVAVLQIMALAEIIHPMIGLVKTGVTQTALQQLGRNFVLFFVIFSHEGLEDLSHVFWLFLAWSSVEIVRYPYYMQKQIEVKNFSTKYVTWFRYSVWIILYPAGMCLEVGVISAAIPLFEMSGKYSFSLPNAWNLSFDYATFLKIYLLLYPVVGIYMLKHMWEQRKKNLGVKIPKSKKSVTSSKRKSA